MMRNILSRKAKLTDDVYTLNQKKLDFLIEHCRDILYLIALFRRFGQLVEVHQLSHLLIKEIDDLNKVLRLAGFSEDEINKAVYLICAAIDEAYIECVYKEERDHSYKSLIGYYYHEEFGGENFFKILEELSPSSVDQFFLRKFVYLLLSLGFRGKYAVEERGATALEDIRRKLKANIDEEERESIQQRRLIEAASRGWNVKLPKPKPMLLAIILLLLAAYIYFCLELQYQKVELYNLIRGYYL